MPPTLSRGELNALGRRLARYDTPDPADLGLLAQHQEEHQPAAQRVGAALREVVAGWPQDEPRERFAINSRTKTSTTLIDKLRRGTRLSTMQDVVGYRVTTSAPVWTFRDQDRFAEESIQRLGDVELVDRRARPSSGYRAVHLIVTHDGFLVEVQIRTLLQDIWANQTESLGDLWGRGLRYGRPPDGATPEQVDARRLAVEANIVMADRIYEYEEIVAGLAPDVLAEIRRLGLTDPAEIETAVEAFMRGRLDAPGERMLAALREFQRRLARVP